MICNFNTKHLIRFEDNLGTEGDLPFAMYFDFETAAPTDHIFDPEQNKMFLVSYDLIAAFHPKLDLKENNNTKKFWAFVKRIGYN